MSSRKKSVGLSADQTTSSNHLHELDHSDERQDKGQGPGQERMFALQTAMPPLWQSSPSHRPQGRCRKKNRLGPWGL